MDPLLRDDSLVVPQHTSSAPSRHAMPRRFSWMAATIVLILAATGCGGGETNDAGSEVNSDRDGRSVATPEPFEISAASALLERARQPGSTERAVLCEQILEDYPESPEAQEALYLLCKLDQNANRHQGAYERFRRLVSEYPAGRFAAEAHQYIWSYESKVAQDDEAHARATEAAIDDLTARLEQHPEEWLGATGRTLTMAYLERDDTEGAIGALKRQIDSDPTNRSVDEQTRITAFFHLGSLHLREENYAEARTVLERGLAELEENEAIERTAREASRTSFETALAQLAAAETGG